MEEEEYLQPLCSSCNARLFEPYIECVKCENINLCTTCFAKGTEILNHRSDHDYSVRTNDFPIFENSNWAAKDEFLLLNAISRYGYGNWEDVSKMLQKYTELQCKEHYDNFYINNVQSPQLPKLSTWAVIKSDPPFLLKDYNSEDLPRKSSSEFCQNIAGYNAYRSDFEMNYDNHAEQLLQFDEIESDDDTDLTQSLQCATVMAYNNRLKERQRRYDIMRRHGLILFRKFNCWMQQYEDTLGKSMCDKLTIFMQFLTGIQFDTLVESLSREKELRLRLYKLYDLRRNGITTIKGRSLFETLKKRRENHLKEMRSSSVRDLDWKQISENNIFPGIPTSGDAHIKSNRRKACPPLEIVGLPDYEKLTEKDRDFCSTVRLPPTSFIQFRELLINENEKNGFLRLCDARKLIKIDVNKTRKLFDLLVQEGAIKKP